MTIGNQRLVGMPRSQFGCANATAEVEHHPVNGKVADVARAVYYTRRAGEEIAHNEQAPDKVKKYAAEVALYAHDLEFFTRQLGLALNMPVMVEPPYLPVDMAALPPPQLLLLASTLARNALPSDASDHPSRESDRHPTRATVCYRWRDFL